MAATNSDDARFVCSICLEEFTNPKLIPCFHTFCLLCLKSYVEQVQSGNAFECPLCRVSIAIPLGGVENFQTNFYIPSSSTTELAELLCDVCNDSSNSVAAKRCLDCDQYLCDNCSQYHIKLKVTREHRLVGLTDIGIESNTSSKIKTSHFCKRHTKEEIKMACIDCNEALCIVCKLTNQDVEDMAKETRKELTDLTSKVHDKTTIVVDNIDAVKRKIDTIKRLKDENIDNVNKQAGLYIQKVNENKERMITDIDTTFKGNISKLEEHLRSLEISQANMKQLEQLANCLTDEADDAGIVSLGSHLKQRLKDSEGNVKLSGDMVDVSQPRFTVTQIPEIVLGFFVDEQARENAKELKKGNNLQEIADDFFMVAEGQLLERRGEISKEEELIDKIMMSFSESMRIEKKVKEMTRINEMFYRTAKKRAEKSKRGLRPMTSAIADGLKRIRLKQSRGGKTGISDGKTGISDWKTEIPNGKTRISDLKTGISDGKTGISNIADVYKRALLKHFPGQVDFLYEWLDEREWPKCKQIDLGSPISLNDMGISHDTNFFQQLKVKAFIRSIDIFEMADNFARHTQCVKSVEFEVKSFIGNINSCIDNYCRFPSQYGLSLRDRIKVTVFICSQAISMYNHKRENCPPEPRWQN